MSRRVPRATIIAIVDDFDEHLMAILEREKRMSRTTRSRIRDAAMADLDALLRGSIGEE